MSVTYSKNHTIDRFRGEYFFLSNFYPHEISCELNNVEATFPSVEHAYQAHKINLSGQVELVKKLQNPSLSASSSKRLGRKVELTPKELRVWEDRKDRVMLGLVRAKFKNKSLRRRLLATSKAALVEGNDWGDKYWGQVDGVGKNKLGIILMQVREEVTK